MKYEWLMVGVVGLSDVFEFFREGTTVRRWGVQKTTTVSGLMASYGARLYEKIYERPSTRMEGDFGRIKEDPLRMQKSTRSWGGTTNLPPLGGWPCAVFVNVTSRAFGWERVGRQISLCIRGAENVSQTDRENNKSNHHDSFLNTLKDLKPFNIISSCHV
ncbi:hypothetical protein BDP81DRAFT_218041 [Colletotrichum phormii]|uniref:Uncharacterized protein n=1 Tax=Colletotrichum phormii TaxID=359342 RepID=A0AAJ0EFJ4_9PEZI|nr:uncharacterized protein BDP81DRAFT_218041 [Colletotrichum phormii]KAK1637059.1 hypothetical protein BDP81DRAFT_218041 [Colletotrichum phormii]